MSLRRFIIFISLSLISPASGQIIFCPFENLSDFEGKWNLAFDIPDYFSKLGRQRNDTLVISATTFSSRIGSRQFGRHQLDIGEIIDGARLFSAERAISAKIVSFRVDRSVVGEPTLAGYENYTFSMELVYRVIDVRTQSILVSEVIDVSRSRNTLGITLFGKPTENKREFFGLDKLTVGSEEFGKTLIAEGLNEAAEKLFQSEDYLKMALIEPVPRSGMPAGVGPRDSAFKTVAGTIILADENTLEIFVNLGKKDGIIAGDKLTVFKSGDSLYDPATNENLGARDVKVGVIIITEVRGDRLCVGTVTASEQRIEKGMTVKKLPSTRQ